MRFRLEIPLGRGSRNDRVLFESAACFIGFWIYLGQRRRGDVIGESSRLSMIAAAAVGAALGSKFVAWFESPSLTLAGQTIMGGLLGE